jgi:hypothetical protein
LPDLAPGGFDTARGAPMLGETEGKPRRHRRYIALRAKPIVHLLSPVDAAILPPGGVIVNMQVA